MAKKRRITPKQKEIRRIERRIKEIQKRGYLFEKIPKFQSWTTQKLKAFKAAELYKYTVYPLPGEGGKVLSGEVRREIERREAGKLGYERSIKRRVTIKESFISIENIRDEIARAIPDEVLMTRQSGKQYNRKVKGKFEISLETSKEYLLRILDDSVKDLGRAIVAKNISKNYQELIETLQWFARYGIEKDKVDGHPNITRFVRLIRGGSLTSEQAIELAEAERATAGYFSIDPDVYEVPDAFIPDNKRNRKKL